MKAAEAYAECSTAKKLKVGCLIVKDNRVISIGYNGTPSGWDNECEKLISEPFLPETERPVTKDEVLHAETNAIAKLARSNESGEGAVAIITHSPCFNCAKLLYQSGISEVYYGDKYRDDSGIYFLEKCNIKVSQLSK